MKRVLAWLWVPVLLVLVCCGGAPDEQSDVTVDLEVAPDPPQVGLATVIVTMRDAGGESIGGVAVALEGTMTHAGMVPVFADAVEVEPGRYEASLEFTMGGDWVIIVRASLPDGRSLERQFDVPGVTMP